MNGIKSVCPHYCFGIFGFFVQTYDRYMDTQRKSGKTKETRCPRRVYRPSNQHRHKTKESPKTCTTPYS